MTLEEMQRFCSSDVTRPQIHTPFTGGEWTYATDGRILIRVPAIPGARTDHFPKDYDKVVPDGFGMEAVEFPPGWNEFFEERVVCGDCEGSGRMKYCESCVGEGEVECECCGQMAYCNECKGTGRLIDEDGEGEACEQCDGAGWYKNPFAVALNGGTVAAELGLLRLALSLPGARLFHGGGEVPMRIEFEGGEGALMPTRQRTNDGVPIEEQWKGGGR
jgi:hypothetical protein